MINNKVEELKSLPRNELIQKWQEIFKSPAPEHLSKTFFVKHLAWQQQYGGLPPIAQKQLDKLTIQYEKSKNIKASDIKKVTRFELAQGTILLREFKGQKHEVTALQKGFDYNGKQYKSLSAIANEITGTRWNGKKFFGVR